jgi:hypothetical protein
MITKTVLKHIYFWFQDQVFTQTTRLAMGAPTSAIFSEIYLQFIEHTALMDILIRHDIRGYFRYVDDLLLVYDVDHTNVHQVLEQFNAVAPTLAFTLEEEIDNKLHYLDLTITRTEQQFTYDIYRKPTTTTHIIPQDSCHPHEHKTSAIRYPTNRMQTYMIGDDNRKIERQTIQHIL